MVMLTSGMYGGNSLPGLIAKAAAVFLLLAMTRAPFAHAINLDFDFAGHFSGVSSAQTGNSQSSNRLLGFGGTASMVLPIFRILGFGAHSDYTKYYQQTAAELPKGGDRSGSRWMPIAPFVDFHLGFARFRFDYQWLGDYKLSHSTSARQSLSYTDPKGYRGEAHICLFKSAERFYKIPGKCISYVGAYYEQVSYATELTDSTSRALQNNLVLREAGVVVGVGF